VVETHAIFRNEHLGGIALFSYSALPIFQEKENPLALKRARREVKRCISPNNTPNSFTEYNITVDHGKMIFVI